MINDTFGSLFVFVDVASQNVEQRESDGVLDQNGEVLDLAENRRFVHQWQRLVLGRAPSFDLANIFAGLFARHALARVPSC